MFPHYNSLKKLFYKKGHRSRSLILRAAGVGPIWTPRQYEKLSHEGYLKNVIVYRSVSLIAKSVASVRFEAGKADPLLRRPNSYQSGAAFIESLMGFLLLSGNAYIEVVEDEEGVSDLYVLRPDRMKIIPGPNGTVRAYEYQVAGQTYQFKADAVTGEGAIIHLKTFHPLNDWYGMSPIEAAALAIDQHNSVAGHNLSLLQNGGRPTGAFILKNGENYLSAEQRESLKKDLKAFYEGPENAGRVLMMEGDFEWKEMSLTPKDLDFLSGKNVSAREIAAAFGVPPMLVGVEGDATYANFKEARYHLWEETIVPWVEFIKEELNAHLMPHFGSERITYNKDDIEALGFKREALWARVQSAPFLTPNEKRELLGFPPISGGDNIQQEEEA